MIGFEVRESRNDDASGYAEWGIPAQDLRSTALTDHREWYQRLEHRQQLLSIRTYYLRL